MSTCAAGYGEHVDADTALAFVDQALPPEPRAAVERRIDICAQCRAIVAEAARADRTGTRSAGTEPPTLLERPAPIVHKPPQRGLAPGDVVGRYVVERPLGAGGMGVVSLARDPELKRAVVIKLVRPDASDDDLEARLRREAQAMAQLSHPNVVQIFDIGRHGDRVFLAMEFIAGQTLDAWLMESHSVDEILAMFRQCGAGLEAAHRAGLLHRDFKPSNVLVDRNGVAKVTDFGLARALNTSLGPMPRVSGVHTVLTHHDEVIGTPAYMAPEQAAGEPLDARTDEFALALALLDALVGQHPAKRTIGPTSDLDAALPKVPPRVRAAIARALREAPAERFPDLAGFLRELSPPPRRRVWPYAVTALAVAGTAAVLVARRDNACVAEAPHAWPREATRTQLLAQSRALSRWHAEYVLGLLDKAADEIGALEVSRCEGKAIDETCFAKRRKDLLSASLDATSCTPGTYTADLEHADALDEAARSALAIGEFDRANDTLIEESSLGNRTGDDSIRGRAVLGLLELARMRGDWKLAKEQATQLDGMLARHHDEHVYDIASATARTFIELGDVGGSFTAIERARAAAKSPDEQKHVRSLDALANQTLRFIKLPLQDLDEDIAADLALERGDSAVSTKDPLRLARAHALAGDTEGALAMLPTSTDVTQSARIAIARAHILFNATRFPDVDAEITAMFEKIRVPSIQGSTYRVGLSAAELVDAWMLRCDAEIQIGKTKYCYKAPWLETAHPKAPQLARFNVQMADDYVRQGIKLDEVPISNAIEVLAAAKADPLVLAELRLRFIHTSTYRVDIRQNAVLARDAFKAAGRTAEVAELDHFLADLDEHHPFGIPEAGVEQDADPWSQ